MNAREASTLKEVRKVFLNRDLAGVLVVSGLTKEPSRNRSCHFHEIFEVRMLFRPDQNGEIDFEKLWELRLTPAGIVHYGLDPKEIATHISLKFDVDILRYLRGSSNQLEIPVKNELEYYGINLACLLTMLNAYCRGEINDFEYLRFALGHLFSALADFFNRDDLLLMNQPITRMCNYIHENYYRSDLAVAQIAESVNLSGNYIQQLFRQYLNCTPREYLINYRLNMAQRLLRRHKYRIKEVAALCGWNCSHYFSNCYRKKFGCSPTGER